MSEIIKVMVADDSEYMRDLITDILKSKGCEVKQAGNGEELLATIVGYEPQIVFMDIVMPQLDGIETTKALREKYPNIKIVVCSAHNNLPIQKRALENGADYFLPKPFDARKIENILDEIIG